MQANLIDSPNKRAKLAARREPYWSRIQQRGYLGYRQGSGGGTWIARWRVGGTKHVYRALDLPTSVEPVQAYDEASKLARNWFDHLGAASDDGRATVAKAASLYVRNLRLRKGEAAARDAEGRIRRSILPGLGGKALDRLKRADIDDWLLERVPADKTGEAERRAKDSANRDFSCLKALLNHAFKQQLVRTDSAWKGAEPFPKVARARSVFLDREQRLALLNAADGAFETLLRVALLTGARYGELRTLRVSDFDPQMGRLSVTKGKTGARTVPLSADAVRLLRKVAKDRLPGACLLTRDDGQPWGHSDQDELMRAAVKAAKLPRKTVLYTLRHTFIAEALRSGIDIHSVAKTVGTSVAMIEKHYAKFLPDEVSKQLSAISMV